MSCTHDCGCSPEIRDARTDEWVQIAPESARAATLTPERPVKAPGQDGDILLTRGKPVEVEWPSGNRRLRYVDEGGYQIVAGEVGDGAPCPWHEARIVRVLTEDKPAQEPVLPRRIEPEDVRVGMVVERRKGECYVGGRVKSIDGSRIWLGAGVVAWVFGSICGNYGWSLWLIGDAPEPVGLDAEATDADTADAVYLSGPMTGLPDFNRPAFHAAAAALREQGYVVINPAEVDLGPAATWSDYMRIHLAEIARRVTQVFVLPGWESSRGAQLEVHVARSLELPVVPVPEPVDPDAAVIEAIITAYRRSPECSTHAVFGESMLDHLRAQGFDVTARAEQ